MIKRRLMGAVVTGATGPWYIFDCLRSASYLHNDVVWRHSTRQLSEEGVDVWSGYYASKADAQKTLDAWKEREDEQN